MKAPKTMFACQECGAQSPKWVGKCPECGSWNSMVEERETPQLAGAGAGANRYSQLSGSSSARLYAEVEMGTAVRLLPDPGDDSLALATASLAESGLVLERRAIEIDVLVVTAVKHPQLGAIDH